MAIRYPAPPQVIQESAVDADVEGTREHEPDAVSVACTD
jgi:hypothetical protein